MSLNPAIKIDNVSKYFKIYEMPQDRLKQGIFKNRTYYKEFRALDHVSFEVSRGETVGIIGQNGSGKSTLLQIIAGTLSPSEGIVELNGRVAALLELGSGFNPEFTGRENIYMNASILGLDRRSIDNLYNEIVSFADIGEFVDRPVKMYSSGMSVRLAFAVQALVPKEILIVDEALAVGDELFQRKCFAKIDEFKKQGGTVLFVSHSGSTIVELCDRAVLLDSGELLICGKSKSVVNHYQKLIYAPQDRRNQIRDQIKAIIETDFETEISNPIVPVPDEDPNGGSDFCDSNLVPKETFYYESRGAEIFGQEISDITGKNVNVLVPEKKYIWRYKAKFSKNCRNVRFGMMIKTVSGLELGGSTTSLCGNGIKEVKSGDIWQVEFTFVPRLYPGTYFVNAGILELTDDGEIYLFRALDMAVFKVLYQHEPLMTGLIDFDINSEINLVNNIN